MNTVPKEHQEAHIWGDGVNFTDLFFFKKDIFIYCWLCRFVAACGVLVALCGCGNLVALRHVKS